MADWATNEAILNTAVDMLHLRHEPCLPVLEHLASRTNLLKLDIVYVLNHGTASYNLDNWLMLDVVKDFIRHEPDQARKGNMLLLLLYLQQVATQEITLADALAAAKLASRLKQ